MLKKNVLSVLLSFSCTMLFAQQFMVENKTADTIPFILTPHNNISIKAILNEVDTLNLMFHTAASGVALIESATEKITSWKVSGADTVKSWGGKTEANWSENNKLQVGPFHWENVFITEDKYSGKGTDGKFGPDLFAGKILELDFAHRILVVHPSMPDLEKSYEPFDVTFFRSSMFLEGEIALGENTCKNRFLIHSGYSGTVLFDDEFVAEHGLGHQLKTLSETELKDSYGNIIKTKRSLLPSLSFGKINFSDIPVGVFEGAIGRQKMSVLGGEVIKRLNWIFNQENAVVYLKPNDLMGTPFNDI